MENESAEKDIQALYFLFYVYNDTPKKFLFDFIQKKLKTIFNTFL